MLSEIRIEFIDIMIISIIVFIVHRVSSAQIYFAIIAITIHASSAHRKVR